MKSFLLVFSIVLFVSCKKQVNSINNEPIAGEDLINVSYGTQPEQKMDLYLPKGRSVDSTKLILLVHGGGWVTGDKAEFTSFIPVIQQKLPNYAIANINYHLASTTANHFPVQENDMKAAVDFLIKKGEEFRVSQKIVLLGASAGGHLVTLQAYKYASPKIKAVVDFYGPVDMVSLYNNTVIPFNKSVIETLMGGTPSTNAALYQQSSPINFVTAQSPPTLIFHGDKDELVNLSQSVALKNKLQSLGIASELAVYPNLGHAIWPQVIMNDAFSKIELFVKANVH